jgi:hypothetical protein
VLKGKDKRKDAGPAHATASMPACLLKKKMSTQQEQRVHLSEERVVQLAEQASLMCWIRFL